MKNLFKSIAATAFFCVPAMSFNSSAQIQVNNGITLQATLDNNNYSGYVMPGTYTVTFVNNFTGASVLQANKFLIRVILPPGIDFGSTYTAPAGWSYTLLNNQEVALTPTVDVPNTFGSNTTQFLLPINTQAAVSSSAFTAYLQTPTGQLPAYQFSNYTVPEGRVSVQNNPLPVLFQSFTATAKGCNVVLNWSTALEKNNSHFVIERSQDGSDFKGIAKTNGAGTSYELSEYSYVDESPANLQNFYRIRQVDFDGQTSTSTVKNVNVDCNSAAISIYPNPAQSAVYVKGLTTKCTIEVYNVVGQRVVSKVAENTVEGVSLSGLADGIYQVKVISGKETIYSNKLIKK